MIVDVRKQIVKWALAGVAQKKDFEYLEVRPLVLTWRPIIKSDCSWFVKLCYWKAGANDPTGLKFDGYGNSDSLFQQGRHIAQNQVRPGDVIVFGPGGSVHAVIVVSIRTLPILCASMGKPGDPSLATLAELEVLGEPTFLRFSTRNRRLNPRNWFRA